MPDPNPIDTARSGTHGRVVPLVGRVLTVLVLGVLGVLATAVTGFGDVGPGATRCASAAPAMAGGSRVALVIDYGTVAGSPGRVDTFCVEVGGGATGFDVLKAAGVPFRLHTSGLVCGLGGYPDSACGEHTATGYRYWAYFHGDGDAWDYQSIGPAASRPGTGSVEGWRFVEGAGNPNDPGPRHAAGFGTICSAPPTVTPPTVTPTTPPPTVPPAASPTTAPSASTVPGAAPTLPGATAGDASTTSLPAADDGAGTSAGTAPTGTASDPGGGEAAGGDGSGRDGTGDGDSAQAAGVSELTVDEGGPSPVGAVVGGAAVLGLGALAVLRFRRPGVDGST